MNPITNELAIWWMISNRQNGAASASRIEMDSPKRFVFARRLTERVHRGPVDH